MYQSSLFRFQFKVSVLDIATSSLLCLLCLFLVQFIPKSLYPSWLHSQCGVIMEFNCDCSSLSKLFCSLRVCLFTTSGGLDSSQARQKKQMQRCLMPLILLCFACPVSQHIFGKSLTLCCAEASPYFLLEGGPCLPGYPAQNIVTRQRLPFPLESGVVYTPSGSISQQHYITLTGFPHLTERNMISLFSPANQNVSYPRSFSLSHSTVSFGLCLLCSQRAVLTQSFESNKTETEAKSVYEKLCLT